VRIRFWALLLTLILSSCVDRKDEVLKQIEEIKREIAHLKASAANNSVLMEDLQNKLLLLQDQVESNQVLLSRTPAPDPVLPVVKLSPDRPAGEMVRTAEFSMDSLPEMTYGELNEGGLIVDMSGQEAPPGEPAAAPPRKRRSFDSRPVELYKRAFNLLKDKQHAEAILEFERFLEEYPNHDYSDNSLYWMGEAYYDTQNYHKALNCFEKVVTLYPDGNKVPDALLKSGLCYANVGEGDKAKDVMDRLVNRYPGTRAASLAAKKLENIGTP